MPFLGKAHADGGVAMSRITRGFSLYEVVLMTAINQEELSRPHVVISNPEPRRSKGVPFPLCWHVYRQDGTVNKYWRYAA